MGSNICFPVTVPINPLRLTSDFRDYYGDQHARFVEATDRILDAECYQPKIYHAPSSDLENAGFLTYLDYALTITPGAFILGFLHNYTSAPSANTTDAPVNSSFRFQISNVIPRREGGALTFRFFLKPVPEAWLLNDQPSSNPQSPITGGAGGGLYVLNPAVRLLPVPYPVVSPGVFKIEFWNMLTTVNTDVRLSLLVAEPGNWKK